MTLGVIATGLIPVIDRSFASFLPPGSIATLGYADTIFQLAVSLFVALQSAVFPFFSEQVARGQIESLQYDFSQMTNLTLFLTLPATVILLFYSTSIIRLLYGHGAFNETAVVSTGKLLVIYSLGLCALSIAFIANKTVLAFQDNRFVGFLGISNLFIKLILNYIFVPIWGASGVALSFVGMTIWSLCLITLRVLKHLGIKNWSHLGSSFGKMGLALLAMIGIVLISKWQFQLWSWSWLLSTMMGVICYLGACWVLRIDNLLFSWISDHKKFN